MSSLQERVRVLMDVAGLPVSSDEVRVIAAGYPALREQVDAVNTAAADGSIVDTLTPSEFESGDFVEQVVTADGPVRTIREAAVALREGATTAHELVAQVLDRVERFDAHLGAYVSTFDDSAREAAQRADAELASGHDRGPLHGIPIAIKDVIATGEGPTRANSRVPAPNWSCHDDAVAVARLRSAGAIIVGKTTTNEFALGINESTPDFPSPRNPWNMSRYAGGSSSGNAIAIAAGLALGAVGTDTGGSIRHPAALNGITGLKPTFGRVPATGVIPLARTIDTVGPMARSAWDCGLLLQAIAGSEGGAQRPSQEPVPEYFLAMDGSVRGLRIGRPKQYYFDDRNVAAGVLRGVEDAIEVLRSAGATVVDVDLPTSDIAKMANHIVLLSEALAYHRESLAEHWDDYGVPLRGLLARGALFDAIDYVQAKHIATMFGQEVAEAMHDCDVLVMPTMPTGARLLEETDPAMMDRWSRASFIGQWSLTGLPSCAVPVGFDERAMPVSMQLVGRQLDESTVLRVADAFQRLTQFHLAAPVEPHG